MKTAKILSMLLLAAMLLPACTQSDDTPKDSVDGTSPADTTTAEVTLDPNLRANHFDNIPETLSFDGVTVTCAFRGAESYKDGTYSSYWITNDICGTNNIGDVVSDAVWERNITVENRLGVKLNWVPTGETYQNAQAFIEKTVLSGDDTIHYFLPTGQATVSRGHEVYMRDMAQMPYVELEQPWWWQFANDALSIDGKTYPFVVGDMLLTNLNQTCVTIFNKDIYEANIGDPNDLYQLVLDGKFTVDQLYELSSKVYKDVNGDGTRDAGDTYGLIWSSSAAGEWHAYEASCGLDLYRRDENGNIIITVNNERTALCVEKLYKLLCENSGSFTTDADINNLRIPFAEGHAVFATLRLGQVFNDEIREMEQEYGIIPNPKLDEEQEQYFAAVHESGTILCVPKTCPETMLEAVGAVLEALNGEAHRTYMDAFIESALKAKYSRDSMTAQCVDLIMAGLSKNLLCEYTNYSKNVLNPTIYKTFTTDPGNFASNCAAYVEAAQASLDAAIAALRSAAE